MAQEKTITVGAGTLYAAELDDNGEPLGLRELGDSEGFSITPEAQNIEARAGDGPIGEKLYDITVGVDRSFSMTLNEVLLDNFALFLIGEAGENEQTSEDSTVETIASPTPGLRYSLGVTADRPTGHKDITVASVEEGGGTTTYEEGTDYEVDGSRGHIVILEDGDIGGEDIDVTYDAAEATYQFAESSEDGIPDRYLYYREDATEGPDRDIIMPRVQVRPEGEMQTKSRDEHQQISLDGEALVSDFHGFAVRVENAEADSVEQ